MLLDALEPDAAVATGRLTCRDIYARYGSHIVCHGISLVVEPGEIVALLGPNGAGKSSFVGAISGTVAGGGRVTLGSRELGDKPAQIRARLGLATIPDTRGLFPSLTVAENVRLGSRLAPKHERPRAIDEMIDLFPILKKRWNAAAGSMSGGEQQMLALAKSLAGRPSGLVLDEPTQGLAPLIVDEVGDLLKRLRLLRLPVLLVEQNLGMVERVADRFLIMAGGRIVVEGQREALRDREAIARAFITHHSKN
ncbi:ABC transporter ATP-binding protein [Nitrobacteraceae bacterium UC4449_H16]|jgi:branched-chain amino acid transport system ATP-binding protein